MTVLLVLSSCVTPKIHNALITEVKNTKNALKQEEKRVIALSGELEEKSGKIVDLKEQITALRNELLQNGKLLVALQSKYDALSETYDLLASKNSRYIADKAKETKKLLEQLEQAQSELFVQEAQLNKLSNSLGVKEEELKKAQEDFLLKKHVGKLVLLP